MEEKEIIYEVIQERTKRAIRYAHNAMDLDEGEDRDYRLSRFYQEKASINDKETELTNDLDTRKRYREKAYHADKMYFHFIDKMSNPTS
ncbi:MAG: hypothetical protein ACI83O_000868 [Patescibacteria group bacterium]|jgi:hypothetical protein